MPPPMGLKGLYGIYSSKWVKRFWVKDGELTGMCCKERTKSKGTVAVDGSCSTTHSCGAIS